MNRTPPLVPLLLLLVLFGLADRAAGQFNFGDFGDDRQAAAPSAEAEADPAAGAMSIETAWSHSAARPGEPIHLAVILDIEKPWHINPHQPDLDFLIPTELQLVDGPAALTAAAPLYPAGEPIEVDYGQGPQTLRFYAGRTVLYMTFQPGAALAAGEHAIRLELRYQMCDETTCLQPTTRTLELTLPVAAAGEAVEPAHAELFADMPEAASGLAMSFFGLDFEIDPTKLWALLPLAALGGLLLNLTPCVLPLIPIKIMGLSKAAGDRPRMLLLGSVMSIGVVSFWLGLGVVIATVSGFTAVNQLFQYPAFTLTVGAIIALMAVGMLGLFAARLPQWVYRINPSQETVHGSFGFGVMTAVLSTPCTAPFMGAAAAWAAMQNPALTLATFASIGVGMALPYQVLTTFPRLVERMPKAGPAGELIKQVMGLLMLAAAAYFVGAGLAGYLVTPPDPPSRAYWWAVGGFIALAGLWLAWRTVQLTPARSRRTVFGGLGVALVAIGLFLGLRLTDRGPIDWIYYTPDRFEAALDEGRVVVMDFTAEWCLNCHALEQSQLHQGRVVEVLNAAGVAPIKVDLTGNNPVGNRRLLDAGRRTIPLLVVYAPDGSEVFKSDAYTAGQVLQAVEQARAYATTR